MERDINYVICANRYDYYRYMFRDIQSDDYVRYYEDFNDMLTSVERKLFYNLRINSIRRIIIKSALKRIRFDNDRPVCFIYFSHFLPLLREGMADIARELFSGSSHVLYFTDAKNINEESIAFSKGHMDAAGIHDKTVADRYDLEFWPSPYPKEHKAAQSEYDLCFIGRLEDRKERLEKIADFCHQSGIKAAICCFDKNKNKEIRGIRYFNKEMPYEETLDIIRKSRCILELGIARKQYACSYLRITEAASMNKKILTDNKNIFEFPICDANRGKIAYFENVEDIDPSFIKGEVEDKWNNKVDYSVDAFFSAVNSSLGCYNKRIVYIARASVPSASTNSVHIAKISEAFVQQFKAFTLIVSKNDTSINVSEYYGLKCDFDIIEVKAKNNSRLGQLLWAKKAVKEAASLRAGHIVTRDPFCALVAVLKGVETSLDLHGDVTHLCGRFYRIMKWGPFVNNKKLHLVMISQGLKAFYVCKYGVSSDRMQVLPDGCTLEDFEGISDREPELSRKRLRIGYFGKTLVGKGIDLIRRLAEMDPEDDFEIYGGTKVASEAETGHVFSDNVHFHGHVPNAAIPGLMCDMDILLLPNQDKLMVMGEDIGKFTSPLKLFEYMASGRVIIASDLPVIREVLNESSSYLADSTDEKAWKRAVDMIKSDPDSAREKAARARAEVEKYTWKSRAVKMVLG